MTNYTKTTNFLAKDSLPSSDTAKIIRGSEFDTEFNNLVIAVASKANLASPALTGVPTAPTAGTSTNTTQVATTAFVQSKVGTLGTMATQNANAVNISGGSVVGITDVTVADGGTGVSTLPSKAVIIGEGTSAVSSVAPGTSGNVLTSNGTVWESTANTTITATTGTLPYYGARGFGYFNGSALSVGTGSKNFGSVAKIATGIFRVTFTTAMPNTNYVIVAMASNSPNANSRGTMMTSAGSNKTTTTFDIHTEERLGGMSSDDVLINWVVYQ